jgi:hypothetical protein
MVQQRAIGESISKKEKKKNRNEEEELVLAALYINCRTAN